MSLRLTRFSFIYLVAEGVVKEARAGSSGEEFKLFKPCKSFKSSNGCAQRHDEEARASQD